MKTTRYLNSILTVLAVLLALNLWTAWTVGDGMASRAYAQGLPDSGAQRLQMIDLLKSLNQKVERLHELIASGKVRVQVRLPDEEQEQRRRR